MIYNIGLKDTFYFDKKDNRQMPIYHFPNYKVDLN